MERPSSTQVTCGQGCGHRMRADREAEERGYRGRRPQICTVCDQQYQPTYSPQQTCSRVCANRLKTKAHPEVWLHSKIYPTTCSVCGVVWCSRTKGRRQCSAECQRKHAEYQRKQNNRLTSARIKERYRTDPQFRDQVLAAAHARRADKLGLGSKQVLLTYLIKRDHGVCGLCHRPVRAKQGPMRPSIDHIIPLSKGGTHELENVQLSHYRCNLSKNNSGSGEQLLLIG